MYVAIMRCKFLTCAVSYNHVPYRWWSCAVNCYLSLSPRRKCLDFSLFSRMDYLRPFLGLESAPFCTNYKIFSPRLQWNRKTSMWGRQNTHQKHYSLVQHALITVESLIALPTSLPNPINLFYPLCQWRSPDWSIRSPRIVVFGFFTAPNFLS